MDEVWHDEKMRDMLKVVVKPQKKKHPVQDKRIFC